MLWEISLIFVVMAPFRGKPKRKSTTKFASWIFPESFIKFAVFMGKQYGYACVCMCVCMCMCLYVCLCVCVCVGVYVCLVGEGGEARGSRRGDFNLLSHVFDEFKMTSTLKIAGKCRKLNDFSLKTCISKFPITSILINFLTVKINNNFLSGLYNC